MPFALYSINPNLIKKSENIKSKQLTKFINDIEELNISQKAILVHQVENNVLKNLQNKIFSISSENLDIQLQEKRILLEDMSRIIGFSLKCELNNNEFKKTNIDFEKNEENQISQNLKIQIIQGDYYPIDYDMEVEKFTKKFLGKINLYLLSKYQKKNEVDTIYIYHKELSNFLIPNDDSIFYDTILKFKNKQNPKIRKEKDNLQNIRKIEYGVNVLYKWWKTIPEEFRPKFKILTDIPKSLKKFARNKKIQINKKDLTTIEKKFENFLFLNSEKDKNIPTVQLIWQKDMPGHLGWKHKRHWIFGTKIKSKENILDFLAIKSDFGVEIVDPNNNSQLSPEMELKVITNKNIKQMKDIEDYLKQDLINDAI